MYEYQKYGRFFAQCAHALEDETAAELGELGARNMRPAYRGVYFESDLPDIYRINYCSRLTNHVLAPLITFQCHSDRYLYKTARDIDWSAFLSPEQSFVIAANASDSNLHHSQYAAQRLKDAIVDQFRENCGARPSVDRRQADVWLNLNIHKNRAIISLDTSGGSLHRRGYRKEAREAPLQETLAAAVVRISGWNGDRPLLDPMCGSGTLLAEALLAAGKVPAGWLKQRNKPTFATLPDFSRTDWERIKKETDAATSPLPVDMVRGGDWDSQAIGVARRVLGGLPGSPQVKIAKRDFRTAPDFEGGMIITNPPYGQRIGERDQVEVLYRELGDWLKQHCTGTTAWILCGDLGLAKCIGLRTKRRIPLFNGPIECRLVEIDLY